MVAITSSWWVNGWWWAMDIGDIMREDKLQNPELVYRLPDDYDPKAEIEKILADKGIQIKEETIGGLTGEKIWLLQQDISKLPKYASVDTGVATDAGGDYFASDEKLWVSVEYDKNGKKISHLDFRVYLKGLAWEEEDARFYWPKISPEIQSVVMNVLETIITDNGAYKEITDWAWRKIKVRTIEEVQSFMQHFVKIFWCIATDTDYVKKYYDQIEKDLWYLQKEWIIINEKILTSIENLWPIVVQLDEQRKRRIVQMDKEIKEAVAKWEISDRYKDYVVKMKEETVQRKQNIAQTEQNIAQLDKDIQMLKDLKKAFEALLKS